jgi:hypothetical protein
MSGKRTKASISPFGPQGEFVLPELPALPELPDLDALASLPDLDALLADPVPSPLDANEEFYGDNIEANTALDDATIVDEFSAIREGRQAQARAIELANDTEYWFAVYFQTREQKEVFLKAMHWFEHGDKYLDGQYVAKKQGISLPPRPAAYKVGRLDKKLVDLT